VKKIFLSLLKKTVSIRGKSEFITDIFGGKQGSILYVKLFRDVYVLNISIVVSEIAVEYVDLG